MNRKIRRYEDVYQYAHYGGGAIGVDFLRDGLGLWLKADAITGLSDTDPVTTWEDSHTGNNDATQGTAANKPLYRTNIINGLPVVRFDATDDFMDTPNNIFTANPLSIFIVFSGTVAAGTHRAINDNGGANFAVGTDTASIICFNGAFISAAGLVDDDPLLATYIHNGTIAQFWIDGVSAGTNGNGNTPGRIRLGAPVGDPLNGDIAEVLVYTKDKSGVRTQIEAYLQAKWNL